MRVGMVLLGAQRHPRNALVPLKAR